MNREQELEALEKVHSPRRRMWKDGRWREDMCSRCRTTHPCPTRRVLAELKEAREKLKAVEDWRERHGQECNGRSEMSELDRILKGGD